MADHRNAVPRARLSSSEIDAVALAQLREWCRRAEDSGIAALREFAQGLPAYASARG